MYKGSMARFELQLAVAIDIYLHCPVTGLYEFEIDI
jgi:hypothetical protein